MPRVLVTRRRLRPLGDLLAERGLAPVHVPCFALEPTGAPPPAGRPDRVLITSPAVAELAPEVARVLGAAPITAVGGRTAASLRALGLRVEAVAGGEGAQALARLAAALRPGERAWHVGAEVVSPGLAAALAEAPFPVDRWPVYRNVAPPGLATALAAALPVDVLTFTAGSAVDRFCDHAEPGVARVAVIGRPTAEAARRRGLPVHAVAAEPTMPALADAALRALSAG